MSITWTLSLWFLMPISSLMTIPTLVAGERSLVVGMRLGGGDIDVTIDSGTRTMRSAWVVLDITDPEQPPELLAEITHADLGFTTSRPALVKRREAGTNVNGETDWSNPSQNEWYLVFGSGPAGSSSTALRSALEQERRIRICRFLFMT